jgi:hypothetical protein
VQRDINAPPSLSVVWNPSFDFQPFNLFLRHLPSVNPFRIDSPLCFIQLQQIRPLLVSQHPPSIFVNRASTNAMWQTVFVWSTHRGGLMSTIANVMTGAATSHPTICPCKNCKKQISLSVASSSVCTSYPPPFIPLSSRQAQMRDWMWFSIHKSRVQTWWYRRTQQLSLPFSLCHSFLPPFPFTFLTVAFLSFGVCDVASMCPSTLPF